MSESGSWSRSWVGSSTVDHLLLRAPSVLVPEEANVLVNPGHPEACGVRVAVSRPFSFDPRLPPAGKQRGVYRVRAYTDPLGTTHSIGCPVTAPIRSKPAS